MPASVTNNWFKYIAFSVSPKTKTDMGILMRANYSPLFIALINSNIHHMENQNIPAMYECVSQDCLMSVDSLTDTNALRGRSGFTLKQSCDIHM